MVYKLAAAGRTFGGRAPEWFREGDASPTFDAAMPGTAKDERAVKRRIETLRSAFLISDERGPMRENARWTYALEWVLGQT